MLTVTAQDNTHRVTVENVSLPRFEAVLRVVNAATPSEADLVYEPSGVD